MIKNFIRQIHNLLIKNKKTVAVAESCTGGLASALLTRSPGSSRYFILGIAAYSNKAKENILKIPPSVISDNGAVSQETAFKMAGNIRKLAKTNFGLAITGIAGPGGGSAKKPVGTVFIAVDSKDSKICKKFYFIGSRITIRKKAVLESLKLLITTIKDNSV